MQIHKEQPCQISPRNSAALRFFGKHHPTTRRRRRTRWV